MKKEEIILPHFKIAQNLEGREGFIFGTPVKVVGDHDHLLIVQEEGEEPYHIRTEKFTLKPKEKPVEEKAPEPVPPPAINSDVPDIKNMSFDEVAKWAKEKSKK